MTKFGLLGAAAVVAFALAAPAMAQQVIYNPGYCAQYYPNANCQNLGPGNPYTGDYQRRSAYRHGNTAPFQDDAYAYDNGHRGGYDQGYAARNDFVCTPGNWFKGEDGRRHLCQ